MVCDHVIIDTMLLMLLHIYIHRDGSKPCTPAVQCSQCSHQNSWMMLDVHPSKTGIYLGKL